MTTYTYDPESVGAKLACEHARHTDHITRKILKELGYLTQSQRIWDRVGELEELDQQHYLHAWCIATDADPNPGGKFTKEMDAEKRKAADEKVRIRTAELLAEHKLEAELKATRGTRRYDAELEYFRTTGEVHPDSIARTKACMRVQIWRQDNMAAGGEWWERKVPTELENAQDGWVD